VFAEGVGSSVESVLRGIGVFSKEGARQQGALAALSLHPLCHQQTNLTPSPGAPASMLACCLQWQELPPGHLISGRSPKVQQFALTPAQLSIRESYERSMDEEMSPRALALLAGRQEDEMRRSLSPERGDLFPVY